MANCSENIGTVNCRYCENNKLYDANNQDGVGKRKKISTKKIIQNSSVADRVKIIQKDLTAISVTGRYSSSDKRFQKFIFKSIKKLNKEL